MLGILSYYHEFTFFLDTFFVVFRSVRSDYLRAVSWRPLNYGAFVILSLNAILKRQDHYLSVLRVIPSVQTHTHTRQQVWCSVVQYADFYIKIKTIILLQNTVEASSYFLIIRKIIFNLYKNHQCQRMYNTIALTSFTQERDR